MKKLLYAMGISAALLSVSCSIEENKLEHPGTESGLKIRLTGYTYPGTKVSIGEKDGDTYPLLWETGDIISIWSRNVTTTPGEEEGDENIVTGNIIGERAELFGDDAGKTSGVFQTSNSFALEHDEDIVITYPGTSVNYTDGKISGTLSAKQEQRKSNSSIHIGSNAFAYATTTLSAGQTEGVKFTLKQKTAFVKVILTTTEFSDLNIIGAKLYSPESQLAGNIDFDMESEELNVTDGIDYVGATLRTPAPFQGTQEVYFTALPCDLTGKEVYLIVTMGNDKKTVTIPARIDGGLLKESCLSVISIENISTATNECEWYEPVEVRDLVDGWAYGPQNTYMVEAKSAGEGATSLKIDVKARGDFSKVRKPKYYGLLTSADMGTRKLVYLPNNMDVYEETPTNAVNADYTIDVNVYDQSKNGRWGVVAIYDENYKVIWSYMIWRYITGDEPKDVEYPGTGIVLLDRVLGGAHSNAYSEEKGIFENSWAYFQWGRKDPFMWSNSGITHYDMKFPPAGADISVAIEHPSMVYGYKDGTNGDWQFKEHRPDLWGGVNNTLNWYDPNGIGHKTIYDPCPEGYRVPDAKVFAEVTGKCEIWEVSNNHAHQPAENINAESPFAGNNTSVLAYPLGEGKYDYWPFAGGRFGNQENWGNRVMSNNRHGCVYWSNNVDPTNLNSGIMLEYCYFSAGYNQNTRQTANRAQSFTIRCQKE